LIWATVVEHVSITGGGERHSAPVPKADFGLSKKPPIFNYLKFSGFTRAVLNGVDLDGNPGASMSSILSTSKERINRSH
jgi:hypothetical protein